MPQTKLKEAMSLDVSALTENKNGLTYLSWAKAVHEFLKIYPDFTYTVKLNDNGLPAFGDKNVGYMVYTKVSVNDLQREMWLPVLDHQNKPMKDDSYTFQVKDRAASQRQGKTVMINKTVSAMSMFDINKAVMRCLTKNFAMFGLALYVFAGEDLPEEPNQVQEHANLPLIQKLEQDCKTMLISKTELMEYLLQKKYLKTHETIEDLDINILTQLIQTSNIIKVEQYIIQHIREKNNIKYMG